MLTSRYMTSVKNLADIMNAIQAGSAPPKFTQAHLKSLGFKSSNDLGILALLKDLKFLGPDGSPTQRYHAYRDKTRAKEVMAEALREAYEDLFHVKEHPSKSDSAALQGKFKATHNVTDRVAQEQTRTFLALLDLADLSAGPSTTTSSRVAVEKEGAQRDPQSSTGDAMPKNTSGIITRGNESVGLSLRYNIEVHLPPTKDVEIYNAIFKSLKEHLLDD